MSGEICGHETLSDMCSILNHASAEIRRQLLLVSDWRDTVYVWHPLLFVTP